eukprot:TRINITY_DN703_c0_g1_i3.p1 TRINITY_DN703_c0_g1~~TRINITY_DN703_c0_g1_i3.p1  ORF type:complete len:262 (+),score=39.53 TRINITY_DN703_c0_g1_i3:44-787(+)
MCIRDRSTQSTWDSIVKKMLAFDGFMFGYVFQHVGMLTLLLKLTSKKSKEWISIDSLCCMLVASIVRLLVIWYAHNNGFTFFHVECFIGTIMTGAVLFFALKRNYLIDIPLFSTPICYKFHVLLAISCFFALIFPPNLGGEYWLNAMMGFFVYLESIALIPQIYVLKKEGNIGGFTSYYMCLVGISRILRLLFWVLLLFLRAYLISLLIADLIHTILIAELMYECFKSFRKTHTLPLFEKGHLSQLI